MSKTFRYDLHLAWLSAQVYKDYEQDLAKGHEADISTLENLAATLKRYDDPELAPEHQLIHLTAFNMLDEIGNPMDHAHCAPEMSYKEFAKTKSHFDFKVNSHLRKFFRNDPDVYVLGDEGVSLTADPFLGLDLAGNILGTAHSVRFFLVDLDGDGIYNADTDDILVQKNVGLTFPVWVDDPLSLAATLNIEDPKSLEGRTFASFVIEAERIEKDNVAPNYTMASLVESLPFYDPKNSSAEPPDLTSVRAWFIESIKIPDNWILKNTVLKILILGLKGYYDTLLWCLNRLSREEWGIVLSDPQIALRIPKSLRLAASSHDQEVLKLYDAVGQTFNSESTDVFKLSLAVAAIASLKRNSSRVDEFLNLFDSTLKSGTEKEPGLIILAIQGYRDLAKAHLLKLKQQRFVRESVYNFMSGFRGYNPDAVISSVNSIRDQSIMEDVTGAPKPDRAKSLVMDLNHFVVFSSFWVFLDVDGRESIRTVYRFNRERQLDPTWKERDNWYVEYYKRVAADQVIRYLTGDRKGLKNARDLDVMNQWGREMQRNGEFMEKIFKSTDFSSSALVEVQDSLNRFIAAGKVFTYLQTHSDYPNHPDFDWRHPEQFDASVIRDIKNQKIESNSQLQNNLANLTGEDLKVFEKWAELMSEVVALERLFILADQKGSDWKSVLQTETIDEDLKAVSTLSCSDDLWFKRSGDITKSDLNYIGRKIKGHKLIISDDRLLSKNYLVLHLLRYCSDHGKNWKEVVNASNVDEAFLAKALEEGYKEDYNPVNMDAILASLTPEDLILLEDFAEKHKTLVSYAIFQEGMDQYRLEHYLFDVPICRLMILENDFKRQAWTWGMHGKLRTLFETEHPLLSQTEILVCLEELARSDFNTILPGWVTQFASSDYPQEIRLAALKTYRDLKYPHWLAHDEFQEILHHESDPKMKRHLRHVDRHRVSFNIKLEEPYDGVRKLPVHVKERHGRFSSRKFAKLIEALNHPGKWHPKDYRHIARLMMRVFGEHSIDVLLAILVKEQQLKLDNWPVFGYVFDNLILNVFGTKTALSDSMSGFVSHAGGGKDGVDIGVNVFTQAVIQWLDSGVDGAQFLREFMHLYDENTGLADAVIQSGFNETRRNYSVRGLKNFQFRALAEIDRLMDEVKIIADQPDFASSSFQQEEWQALWNRLYQMQAMVAFDSLK